MALPSYWVSLNRKDLAEKAIVARREREASRAQRCKEVNFYHQDLALKSSKYKSLEEPLTLRTARANEESRIKENLKADKKDRLEVRRQRLAHFLAVETEQYMKELNELKDKEREKDPWNICKLKEQIEDLQRKRKEGEQNMQKRYMHHLYRSNNIYAKEDEEEQLKKESSDAWKQRREELEKLNLEKKQKELERKKTFELEQLKATREAQEVEILQLEEQEKWSNFVQGKVEELNEAENETKKLKIEKQILLSHMENLVTFQQRRDLVRDLQKKGFQRIQALWQPKEKLRKMSNEVQHALDSCNSTKLQPENLLQRECVWLFSLQDLDLKLLKNLCAMNDAAAQDTALALLNLDDVNDAKCKVEMQIAMEKDRELEIQQLFNEEASKLWEKRSEEWTLESIARDQILNNLFKSLSNEISKKMENNIEQQKKFLHIKENCLKEIDEANENARSRKTALEEKMTYFVDKARRLGDELQVYRAPSS